MLDVMAIEFVACYETSNHEIWLWNFVTGLCILEGVERPLKLYCDNKSAVLYSNNNKSSYRSKHIDIKFLIVKERVQSGQISIEHIGTNSMIVDPLSWAHCSYECYFVWGYHIIVGVCIISHFIALCLILGILMHLCIWIFFWSEIKYSVHFTMLHYVKYWSH